MIDHSIRAKQIGGSEVAALFGLHPWLSHYQLWQSKALEYLENDQQTEAMEWGNRLEEPIAQAVAERTGWAIAKPEDPTMKHSHIYGMGGSPDRMVGESPVKGGILEIKTSGEYGYRHYWPDGPPMYVQLQLQHYLAVTKRSWGAIAVLVGGQRLHISDRIERHQPTIDKITSAIDDFWLSVWTGKPPALDPATDQDAIRNAARLLAPATEVTDLSDHPDAAALLSTIRASSDETKVLDAMRKQAQTDLLAIAPRASRIVAGSLRATITRTADKPGSPVTPDMVGTLVGARKGSIRITVSEAQS